MKRKAGRKAEAITEGRKEGKVEKTEVERKESWKRKRERE